MSQIRSHASWLSYAIAIGVSAIGSSYFMWVHLPLWLSGKWIINAFSAFFVFEYILISLILWITGYFLYRRHQLDWVLFLLGLFPILLLAVLPSRFAAA
ncbi:MAG: hypothetical protein LBQ32_12965 [Burkholderiaceae bacterium]|jgi:hypothetical protein|nr:hypothetical protein [Burkholderiaceae bacterium]